MIDILIVCCFYVVFCSYEDLMFGSDGEDSDNDEASFSMKKVHAPGYISLIHGTKPISVFSTIIVVDRMTL